MIIARTPLRISFAGGGSDIQAYYKSGYGAVLSTAIDKSMYVTVNNTFDNHIRIIYSKVEYVDSIDNIEHNLAREALKLAAVTEGGLDICYMGDMLPAHAGSGLGASSSLTVGMLNALYNLKNKSVTSEKLAREACKIEIELLDRPIGKQDQYAAAYGGMNYIQFNADESVEIKPVTCKPEVIEKLFHNIMVFYTNTDPKSDVILSEQSKNSMDNKHVIDEMVNLAQALFKALQNNQLSGFGDILHQGWLLKQKLATEISNPLIDEYYESARKAGAIGGKILGSGGGGFLLLYCEDKDQNKVRESLAELREASFKYEPEGSKIIYNNS